MRHNQFDVDRYRRQEMLQEAEAHRLAKTVREAEEKAKREKTKTKDAQLTPLYAPALAELGQRLVEIGENLQSRYGQDDCNPRPEAV